MTYAWPACSFLLSIASLYLAWRIYRGETSRSPKRPGSHRKETETSAS